MKFKKATLAVATAALGMGMLLSAPAVQAQSNDQFIPLLVYRTASLPRWASHGPMASRTTSSW